jgi:hypothetical protein
MGGAAFWAIFFRQRIRSPWVASPTFYSALKICFLVKRNRTHENRVTKGYRKMSLRLNKDFRQKIDKKSWQAEEEKKKLFWSCKKKFFFVFWNKIWEFEKENGFLSLVFVFNQRTVSNQQTRVWIGPGRAWILQARFGLFAGQGVCGCLCSKIGLRLGVTYTGQVQILGPIGLGLLVYLVKAQARPGPR